MDWNKLAGPAPWYGVAMNNAKNVGARTGDLLLFMMDKFGLSALDVHVIGWSLGGQLVAFIGQQTDGQLARITGLDPAGTGCLIWVGNFFRGNAQRFMT